MSGTPKEPAPEGSAPILPEPSALDAATSPHLAVGTAGIGTAMRDVLVGLAPAAVMAVVLFGGRAAVHLAVAVAAAVATEALACRLRRRPTTVGDGSAALTGLLLALSLPVSLSPGATALGAVVAVGLGKAVFGGLGQNPFNPAMVGRAFLAACFPVAMTTWVEPAGLDGWSGATPLVAGDGGPVATAWQLLGGRVPGSLGETSGIALVAGGAFVLFRRAGDWRPTAGMLGAIAGIAALEAFIRGSAARGVVAHLGSGGALLGAFFIVTDPVTSPLARSGRWVFGALVGGIVMAIRLGGSYPEGVMYAVLLANAVVPLIDRLTAPRPLGGPMAPPSIVPAAALAVAPPGPPAETAP